MINFVKKYFNSSCFSGRPAIHVTIMQMINYWTRIKKQTSLRDTIVLWVPIYNTNEKPEVCVYIKIT